MYTSSWTPDDLIRALDPWIARQRRDAWLPRVEQRRTLPTESSFCGAPWLSCADDWSNCAGCKRPLQLFVQLNLDSLPEELDGRFGTGYLQLFYCRHTADGSCHGEPGWEVFSDACSRVRIVHPSNNVPVETNHNCHVSYPPRGIVGWDRIDDYPNDDEHDRLGLVYDYGFRDNTPAQICCDDLDIHCVGMPFLDAAAERIASHDRDKLSGWPNWIQGSEYPACSQCRTQMQFVMQIDSEDNIPYMFGDTGMGYITQCPDHLDEVAFGWACC